MRRLWQAVLIRLHLRYTRAMITGAHYLLYTTDPEADRKFFRDILKFRSVDVGHGWLIFAMPPAEMASILLIPILSNPMRSTQWRARFFISCVTICRLRSQL